MADRVETALREALGVKQGYACPGCGNAISVTRAELRQRPPRPHEQQGELVAVAITELVCDRCSSRAA